MPQATQHAALVAVRLQGRNRLRYARTDAKEPPQWHGT